MTVVNEAEQLNHGCFCTNLLRKAITLKNRVVGAATGQAVSGEPPGSSRSLTLFHVACLRRTADHGIHLVPGIKLLKRIQNGLTDLDKCRADRCIARQFRNVPILISQR